MSDYRALVSIRNTELSVYWARYNIQSAINCGFLVAVLASKNVRKNSKKSNKSIAFSRI